MGGFTLQHLQLGFGRMKGHIIARDFHHTRLVRRMGQYNPLVTLVNGNAKELLPEWFTWATMQFFYNVPIKPHQHLHDSSPCSAMFSTGHHTQGHICVEVGGGGG